MGSKSQVSMDHSSFLEYKLYAGHMVASFYFEKCDFLFFSSVSGPGSTTSNTTGFFKYETKI